MEENKIEGTSSNHQEECNSPFNEEVIKNLSDGLVTKYKPHLQKTREQLKELTEKQSILIEQIHNENLKISWAQSSVELQSMFDTVNAYHNKLINIKKDVKNLYERNLKLKKRAIRLQQHKEKIEYLENQQREMELKKEEQLIAKQPSSS